VLGSTIRAEDRQLSANIAVTYQPEPALHMLVPKDMRESYLQRADGSTVTGMATYTNFRQFQVKVDEKIAPIK
jgi:cell wall assembly regulator SMI1